MFFSNIQTSPNLLYISKAEKINPNVTFPPSNVSVSEDEERKFDFLKLDESNFHAIEREKNFSSEEKWFEDVRHETMTMISINKISLTKKNIHTNSLLASLLFPSCDNDKTKFTHKYIQMTKKMYTISLLQKHEH